MVLAGEEVEVEEAVAEEEEVVAAMGAEGVEEEDEVAKADEAVAGDSM